ncbi:hypothetical protein I7I48_01366 [Histoplasma ohiense]|nr:hypothetical protein I7I48_01366 [Histoplasma ohiense (nom. inval.)]
MFSEVIYVSMLKVTTVLLIFISMAAALAPHYHSEKYPKNGEAGWDYCATEVWCETNEDCKVYEDCIENALHHDTGYIGCGVSILEYYSCWTWTPGIPH